MKSTLGPQWSRCKKAIARPACQDGSSPAFGSMSVTGQLTTVRTRPTAIVGAARPERIACFEPRRHSAGGSLPTRQRRSSLVSLLLGGHAFSLPLPTPPLTHT